MVWHQNVCMNRALMPSGRFAKTTKVKTTIRVSVEAQCSIVTPLNDVQRDAGQF